MVSHTALSVRARGLSWPKSGSSRRFAIRYQTVTVQTIPTAARTARCRAHRWGRPRLSRRQTASYRAPASSPSIDSPIR